MLAVKGLPMDKWLCWLSMTVAVVLLLLFLADLVLGLATTVEFKPFGGVSYPVDVLCIIASGVLFYLALDAYRDVR